MYFWYIWQTYFKNFENLSILKETAIGCFRQEIEPSKTFLSCPGKQLGCL